MDDSEHPGTLEPRRGLLARPLDALVFLLPLVILSEAGSIARPDQVIAFDLMRKFFGLFGYVGTLAPGLGVVIILVATHFASREKWRIHWSRVGLMYPEAVILALPLLVLNTLIPLTAGAGNGESYFSGLAVSIGAGIYEELVFRLILISIIMIIGVDLLKLGPVRVAVVAVLLSSLAFAAHHHQPIGAEPFDPVRFAFRTIAGMYLAIVFWFRGYGLAAGCHAAYNAALILTASGGA